MEIVSFAAVQLIRDTFPTRYIFSVLRSDFKKEKEKRSRRTSLTHFKSGN